MALFKIISFNVLNVEYKFRINVSEEGVFWCKIPENVVKHTNLLQKEEASSFKEIEGKITWAIENWRQEETIVTYHIKYQLCLSNNLKRNISEDIMDKSLNDVSLWKKTSTSGSNYYHDDESALVFWFMPMVRKTEGDNIVNQPLEIATEDNWKIQKIFEQKASIERGEEQKYNPSGYPKDFVYYEDDLHKPFLEWGDETLFIVGGRNSWKDKAHDFWIPLTPDSWKFFNSINDLLVNISSKMLSFLSLDDPEKLLENISKSLSSNKLLD